MSLSSVRDFLARHAPDLTVLEMHAPTPTVADAAAVHGVAPGQIAKTLSLWVKAPAGDQVVVLVMAGDARLDNRKAREALGGKVKMLSADEVVHWTGHPVGGVCPFGLAHPLPVWLDRSLQRHAEVLPAAGDIHAAVRLTPARLAELVQGRWADVAQDPAATA